MLKIRTNSLQKFLRRFFQKATAYPRAHSPWSSPAGDEIPYRSKAPRGVNANPIGFAEGNTQVGVPLLLHRQILFLYPLFSLTQEAQRKKLGKKEMPQENFAPCEARPTLRALDGRSLFEKATENKSVCSREVPDKSKFEFTVKQKALCNTQRFVFIIPTRTSRRIPLAQYRIP